MKISFVIPAYNEEKLLPECLGSVLREIARAKCDAEIIVVNNASSDKTGEIARSFPRVKVIDEPRKGLTQARQSGYLASSGDLIANIDADTQLTPEWIPTALLEFSRDDRLVALSGPYVHYDLPAFQRALVRLFYWVGYAVHIVNQYVLHAGAMLQGGNFVLRKSAVDAMGGYDTSITFYGEDTDIAKHMQKLGRVKWTFRFVILTSARRLKKEGIVASAWRYTLNHLSVLYFGQPLTKQHIDIRT